MSIEVMSLVFKRSLGSPAKKVVMLAMADAANSDGSGIWRGAANIAAECDISERTVYRVWDELEAAGLIVRVGTRDVPRGKVIIWAIDLRALVSLPQADDKLSGGRVSDDLGPHDKMSPTDKLSGGENTRPPDTVSCDHLTQCQRPPDTVSDKPPLNHPRTTQRVRASRKTKSDKPARQQSAKAVTDQILALLPVAKRQMAPKDTLPKVVADVLAHTDPESLLAAVKACYSLPRHTEEGGQYAPAIHSWLKKGVWKNWIGPDANQPSSPAAIELTDDEWKNAMRCYADNNGQEWTISLISPAPHEPGCTAPAKMLRHAARLLPHLADAILANCEPKEAAA